MLEHCRSQGHFTAPMSVSVTKGGRPRTVQIPLSLARELRNWTDTRRLTLVRRFQLRTKQSPSDRLFLSDARGHEGTPIQGHTLYRVFKGVAPRPLKWHPHFGRHTFACFYLLHALEADARSASRSYAELGPDWVQSRGQFWLDTLRRQLGHASEASTDLYLRWLATATGIAELAGGWHRFLSDDGTSRESR
jgi:integrase